MNERISVNGPVNVLRLEGQINGIDKHLYVFMDYHNNVAVQTQCEDIESLDVMQYMYTNLKNSDKEQYYDFFLEISKSRSETGQYINKGRYIDELMRFFSMQVNKKYKSLENVRFHTIDEREHLKAEVNDLLDRIEHRILLCWNDAMIFEGDIPIFMDDLGALKATINLLYKTLYINKKNNRKTPIEKFVFKIKEKYKHPKTKNVLKDLFEANKASLEEIMKLITKMENMLTTNQNLFLSKNKSVMKPYIHGIVKTSVFIPDGDKIYKLLQEFRTDYDYLYILCLYAYVMLVDIYFMRRFIDKDYIMNGIVYTGMAHSVAYVYLLVKYCNFKITHSAYSKVTNEKLEKIIKSTEYKNITEIEKILYPNYIMQCSKLDDFPRYFN